MIGVLPSYEQAPFVRHQSAATHSCSAPTFEGTSPAAVAANSYLDHHRTCQHCKPVSTAYCSPEDWYHPTDRTLCARGWALFRAWQRVANSTPPQENVCHRPGTLRGGA